MAGRQRILPIRREYNRWVANQTLEDYALRFTAKRARQWTAARVGQTAIGAISFLALEAIGGAITLSYGFTNTLIATIIVSFILLATGLPISRYAARYGVDIDLLTRGAGFGYIGSTITSLIYATFTFILFAIEAAIMSTALELCFGVPLWLGYILSALAVIPIVTHGVTWLSRFQISTQPLWIILNVLPVGFILWKDWPAVQAWSNFGGTASPASSGFDILGFGAAASVILALMPQIGEQVDILRFLPARRSDGEVRKGWRRALFAAGPGWIVLGAPKLLFGSFLAVLAIRYGVSTEHAAEPAYMYQVAFGFVTSSPVFVTLMTVTLLVVSQLKINVVNAYAGSLAWSNFFSRLTHSHPGRVVWLVFNVAIALLLMELGIYKALEATLGLFAIVAVAWLGAIVGDLSISKRLGFSPPGIEFKRAHLYDINPVGFGAMTIAAIAALVAFSGWLGPTLQALSTFVSLCVAIITAPVIAWLTKGRYYLARKPRASWALRSEIQCSICEHPFEPEDMAYCPAYAAPICSLCCSLDARCHDLCKPKARLPAQIESVAKAVLPQSMSIRLNSRLAHYAATFAIFAAIISAVLAIIYYQTTMGAGEHSGIIGRALWAAFFVLLIVAGIATWFFVLAQESRHVAQEESARQTTLLLKEIEAHRRTDAELQRAKEVAEAANLAKSRYVVGLSHELRTPLNAVLGYAQLLERDEAVPVEKQGGISVIRRSAEHLSGLIDGLLDISKIEAGRLQLTRDEVRIRDFLGQIVHMFELQAEAKALTFRHAIADSLPEVVYTDEKRLRQILINLLSNAIKFTESGRVSFDLVYRSQIATITINDTGPGIAAGDLSRIFEPFERGHATRQPGLGLGLTITKLLSELMGGDIQVTSELGKGSSFRVRLMLTPVNRPAEAVQPNRMPLGYHGPRRTVMVVDDDLTHRELMREILWPLGFVILTAEDGPACLALVAEVKPDLFILDISMPGISGWELARTLRATGHDKAAIMMLSANIGERPPVQEEESAHDEMLPKPFDLKRLLDRVRALLDIEWIDEVPVQEVVQAKPPLIKPEPAHLEELLHLGRIGYVRGIEAKLAALETEPQSRAFVEEMRTHVRNFDLRRYLSVLEAMADE